MAPPLDPRLLRHARAARGYVVLTAVLGLVTALLVIAQALLLAQVIAGVAIDGRNFAEVRTWLIALAVLVAGRALISWAQDRFGHRAATTVIAQLRARLIHHVSALGPAALDGDRGPAIATLTTRGLDALDGYLVKYLPQLLLAATVTPAALGVLWWHDTISGIIMLLTLPLIPAFMILVGLTTQEAADRRLRTIQRLGGQVLDLVAGLPTLRALGRERGQGLRVREVSEAYRRATMKILRQAFLSALALETLTTLGVALVAVVGISKRLQEGNLTLQIGLAVLILAPEVYLPLRMVGVHYHASVDGLAAAAEAFAVLEQPLPPRGTVPCPDLSRGTVRLVDVDVVHEGRDRATPAALNLTVTPGRVIALVGPSGVGKSSAVQVLLGLRPPTHGQVLVAGADGDAVDLVEIDRDTWFAHLSWVPQRPLLVPGTLADNLRLVAPDADRAALDAAARASGLDAVVADVPNGWDTLIGSGGHGLSGGQRQRLALARALLRPAALVVLDEPTAHLDAATEQIVHTAVAHLRERGSAVVLVAHRPALIALADEVVTVLDGPASRPDPDRPDPDRPGTGAAGEPSVAVSR